MNFYKSEIEKVGEIFIFGHFFFCLNFYEKSDLILIKLQFKKKTIFSKFLVVILPLTVPVLTPYYSYCLPVLIPLQVSTNWPRKRRNSQPKKSPWEKDKRESPKKPLRHKLPSVVGLYCRIVTWD